MVTAEMTELEAKNQELQGLQVEFSEAQAIANQELTELTANSPAYDLNLVAKMVEINKPLAALQNKINKIQAEVYKLDDNARLENTTSMRSAVEEVIKEQLSGLTLSAVLNSASGTMKLVDNKLVVQINPVFTGLDMEGIETIVASQGDPVAFKQASLTNLAISFKDGEATLTPLGKEKTRASFTKSPVQEFFAGGNWITNREFLQMLINSNDVDAVAHPNKYAAAVKVGTDAYKMAVDASDRLGVERRNKFKGSTKTA